MLSILWSRTFFVACELWVELVVPCYRGKLKVRGDETCPRSYREMGWSDLTYKVPFSVQP